jgi:hypothetical protein
MDSKYPLEEPDFGYANGDIRKMQRCDGLSNLFSRKSERHEFIHTCGDFFWLNDDECFCKRPPNESIITEVRVVGDPVSTTPAESTFNVKIYWNFILGDDADWLNGEDDERFYIKYDFMVADTLDNTSLDLHDPLLVSVSGYDTKVFAPKDKFSGKKSRDSYILAFNSLVKKLLNPQTRSRGDQPPENPHVVRKTKQNRK